MAASNEVTRSVSASGGNESGSVVDALTDVVASITDVATRQQESFESVQAGFTDVVESNDKVLESLNQLAEVMSAFAEGGNVGRGGQTGGAGAFGVTSSEATRRAISEGVAEGVGDLVDAVRDEAEQSREQAERLAQRQSQEQSDMLSQLLESFKSQKEDMDSISSFIKSMSGNGSAQSKVSSIGSLLKNFLEGPEAEAIIGGIGSIAASIGVSAAIWEATKKGIQWNYQANQTSIEQTGESGNYGISIGMGIENQMTAFSTGMSTSQVQNVQDTLTSEGADYGTDEYNTGLGFATSASSQYGMDPKKAAELYMQTVVRGNMEMNDLNVAMASLRDIVQDTGISMSEAVQDFQDSVKDWSNASGSDTTGAEWASELTSYADTELSNYGGMSAISSFAASYSEDAEYMRTESQYEESGLSEAEASSVAAWDIFVNGRSSSSNKYARALTQQPLTEDGKTLVGYIQDQDWDGLQEALDNLSPSWKKNYGGLSGIRRGIKAQFPGADHISNSKSIVNFFKGMSETMSDISSEQKNNVKGEDEASDIANTGATGDNSVLAGESATTSWDNGYWFGGTTENDIDSATNENLFSGADVTSDNLNENAWNDILKMAVSYGYLSEEDVAGMNEDQAQDYAKAFLEKYQSSDMYQTNNSFLGKLANNLPFIRSMDLTGSSFSDYMKSEEGQSVGSELSTKYGSGSTDKSAIEKETIKSAISEAISFSGAGGLLGGNIVISLADNAVDAFYAYWKEGNDEENRTNGTGS